MPTRLSPANDKIDVAICHRVKATPAIRTRVRVGAVTPLVTHHFALDNIEEAFDLFSHQQDGVLKVALHPGSRDIAAQIGGTVAAGVDQEC